MLVHRRKRHPHQFVVEHTPASHNGHVFRNSQACLEDGEHRAPRRGIVVTEDRVGPRFQFQQAPHEPRSQNVIRFFILRKADYML